MARARAPVSRGRPAAGRARASKTARSSKPARSSNPSRANGARAAELSAVEARQLALAAQGFGPRPEATTLRHVHDLLDDIALIQVDSVNVVCRSQELPLWARLGAHARDALPALCKQGEIFEYWAHEASLMPVELQPLLR